MSLYRDLIFLILQFCNEENLQKTAHMLEQETGFFFDIEFFEDLILRGDWDEAEKYLEGFIGLEENKYSIKIYFEIRKQKFLEALDKHNRAMALDILLKDLKVFASSNVELFKEMTELLTMDDFRKHASLSSYGDTMSARKCVMNELKFIIEAAPQFQGKLKFPQIYKSRLRRLINQSLNWQHIHCANPQPEPQMNTLFLDHKCPEPDHPYDLSNHKSALFSKTSSLSESPLSQKSTCNLHENYLSLAGISDGVKVSGSTSTTSCSRTLDEEKATDHSENMGPQTPMVPNDILLTQSTPKIVEVSHCQSLRLPCEVKTSKICRLMYTNAGDGILALAADGIHLLWKWSKSDSNFRGEATTNYAPQLWKPRSGLLMINGLDDNNSESVSPCFALSKNDSYVISASGGMITLFNMINFKKIRSFKPAPPAATCIAFYPPDNNIIAVGMDDSTILIYNVRVDEIITVLKGHSERISGLAFSNTLRVLVSSGVDAQIFVWDSTTWEKKQSTILQTSTELVPSELSETYIQFHQDQKHFLAVHETQLAVFETTTLELVKQWVIGNFCARISSATLSCDCQMLYAVLRDGIILILGAADLLPRFEIDPSAYLSSDLSSRAYPLVIAAHPQNANQFALGLSDGGVIVIEPQQSQGEWTSTSITTSQSLTNE